MSRYFPRMKMAFASSVTVDGEYTDAAETTFFYKIGLNGLETKIIPTRVGVGTYVVELTPDQGGHLYYRWDTDGDLDVAQEGVVNIAGSAFA